MKPAMKTILTLSVQMSKRIHFVFCLAPAAAFP